MHNMWRTKMRRSSERGNREIQRQGRGVGFIIRSRATLGKVDTPLPQFGMPAASRTGVLHPHLSFFLVVASNWSFRHLAELSCTAQPALLHCLPAVPVWTQLSFDVTNMHLGED